MKYDVLIIGGGIVGLATALKLLQSHPQIQLILLEKENQIAQHQTGHNSGVIHSGIYYKPGSLKALNCTAGYRKLIEFCQHHDIAHDICGKIIVSTHEKELPMLETLYQRGIQNGLKGLKKVQQQELQDYEPHVQGIAGIHVPQTGIIDFKRVAQKYADLIQERGGHIHLSEVVHKIRQKHLTFEIITQNRTYEADFVISCAGLHSDRIAQWTQGNPSIKLAPSEQSQDLPSNLANSFASMRIIPFRGEYYTLKPEKHYLVKNLIYPVPDPAFPFLGVHFTRFIQGGIEAGPNAVLAFKREGYSKISFSARDTFETWTWPGFIKVASRYWRTGLEEWYRSLSKGAFVKALQKLIPEIKEEDLHPGGSGVRAQACSRNGQLIDDFYIQASKNIIHVCNAPSPAATASLAIGETIAELWKKHSSLK